MTSFPRFAIYFVPARDSALYRFGSEMIGYDAFAGATAAQPHMALAAFPDWPELTREPRVYGFHATLKAPFSLAEGVSENELTASFDAFASQPRRVPVFRPLVDLLGNFIAIVPEGTAPALKELANDCVIAFDRFRAPLSPEDRARRLQSQMTENQAALLDRWGYPYVFEEFRFHMTLSGSLPQERHGAALAFLRESFSALALDSIPADGLGLFRQDTRGAPFVVHRYQPLRGR